MCWKPIQIVFCHLIHAHAHVSLARTINFNLCAWIKMSVSADGHARKDYYLTAMSTMLAFLTGYENPSQAIHTSSFGQRGKADDGKQPEGD